MLSTHHSDKWGTLRNLKDNEDRPVLDGLRSPNVDNQVAAVQTISNSLSHEAYLAGEVLHAGLQGLVAMSFNAANASDEIGNLMASVFERTVENEIQESRKRAILNTTFRVATEGETAEEKALATTLFEKLNKADPAITKSVIEDKIYPEEWDGKTPIAQVIRNYKPKF